MTIQDVMDLVQNIGEKEISVNGIMDILRQNPAWSIGAALAVLYAHAFVLVRKDLSKMQKVDTDILGFSIFGFAIAPVIMPIYYVMALLSTIPFKFAFKHIANTLDFLGRKRVVDISDMKDSDFETMRIALNKKGYTIDCIPITQDKSSNRNGKQLKRNNKPIEKYAGNLDWVIAQAYRQVIGVYKV